MSTIPRLVISAPSSGHGKTAVSVGLLAALSAKGYRAVGFKIGPDHVDAAYLGLAAGRPGRNLDPRMVGAKRMGPLFAHSANSLDIAVIEGTMGLFDGLAGRTDSESTAQISGLLRAPVVLVVDVGAMGQSVAALVHGFRAYDELLWLGGVILNRVASSRHEQLLREALDDIGVPVLGALRLHALTDIGDAAAPLPSRQHGVAPVAHHNLDAVRAVRRLGEVIAAAVDIDRTMALARSAPRLTSDPWSPEAEVAAAQSAAQTPAQPGGLLAARPVTAGDPVAARIGRRPVIGVAFSYPETAELLTAAGADVVPFDPLRDDTLPTGVDGLVVGGALPESYAEELTFNSRLRAAVAAHAAAGRPISAEGTGLVWLCREFNGRPMCGVIDAAARETDLVVLGYREATARSSSVLLPVGAQVVGHKMHRTTINPRAGLQAAWTWSGGPAEGFVHRGVHASYLGLHWAGTPAIAPRFVSAANAAANAAPTAAQHGWTTPSANAYGRPVAVTPPPPSTLQLPGTQPSGTPAAGTVPLAARVATTTLPADDPTSVLPVRTGHPAPSSAPPAGSVSATSTVYSSAASVSAGPSPRTSPATPTETPSTTSTTTPTATPSADSAADPAWSPSPRAALPGAAATDPHASKAGSGPGDALAPAAEPVASSPFGPTSRAGVALTAASQAAAASTTAVPPPGVGTVAEQPSGIGTAGSQASGSGTTAGQAAEVGTAVGRPSGIGTAGNEAPGPGAAAGQGAGAGTAGSQASGVGTAVGRPSGVGAAGNQAAEVGTAADQPSGGVAANRLPEGHTTASEPAAVGSTANQGPEAGSAEDRSTRPGTTTAQPGTTATGAGEAGATTAQTTGAGAAPEVGTAVSEAGGAGATTDQHSEASRGHAAGGTTDPGSAALWSDAAGAPADPGTVVSEAGAAGARTGQESAASRADAVTADPGTSSGYTGVAGTAVAGGASPSTATDEASVGVPSPSNAHAPVAGLPSSGIVSSIVSTAPADSPSSALPADTSGEDRTTGPHAAAGPAGAERSPDGRPGLGASTVGRQVLPGVSAAGQSRAFPEAAAGAHAGQSRVVAEAAAGGRSGEPHSAVRRASAGAAQPVSTPPGSPGDVQRLVTPATSSAVPVSSAPMPVVPSQVSAAPAGMTAILAGSDLMDGADEAPTAYLSLPAGAAGHTDDVDFTPVSAPPDSGPARYGADLSGRAGTQAGGSPGPVPRAGDPLPGPISAPPDVAAGPRSGVAPSAGAGLTGDRSGESAAGVEAPPSGKPSGGATEVA